MKRKELCLEVISWLLFILFVYTASTKLIHYKLTISNMNNQPFDNKYSSLLTFGLPIVEFIIAGLLIFKKTMLSGLWSFLGLMALFTGYIILIKVNYYGRIPCSCGGVISGFNWTQHLFFNLAFIGLAIIGILLHKQVYGKTQLQIQQMA
ncbi:hypothetical protein SAMN05421788_1011516 [Filimonas lacunae]|uniref:Methylamine utilisation protein MauE domain-containing protein n=1 Tax=Filimonas lacunae TaxID=477680 RepID=A0A173MRH1_9BACT|nr:MauE/DoxX family redox-associated membrane protein [Filimonas lacunae]BAV10087.1 hypothetical protein FLA_6142 [Filimonas lacunae]SIS83813.1 hypothetical protein SAMN05421788_1011516 [Filimonas lacunae]